MRHSRCRLAPWLATVVAVASCADHPLPVEPPSFQIQDAAHNGGNTHFYFLPPVVKATAYGGVFDGSVAPVVEICEWNGSACANAPIASFSMTTGTGSELLRVVPADEAYTVNWHTDQFGLDPSRTYRIRVLLSGSELGHADVDAVSTGKDMKNIDTGEFIALVDGRTLPIKFRIEVGALSAGPLGTITRLSTGSASDQQTSPVISGTTVAWANLLTPGPNFDIGFLILGAPPPVNLTNTSADLEFSPDIDAGNMVWVHTGSTIPGDIVLYLGPSGPASAIAVSTTTTRFMQPAVDGGFVVFQRVTGQLDLDLYNWTTGNSLAITNDAAVQSHPRLSGDLVVYEDYNSGNADVFGYRISTGGIFPMAGGSGEQFSPDVDGANVVYVDNAGGTDQIFLKNVTTGTVTQLTTVPSNKTQPRISGSRVVWSDDRNGSLDIYTYNLATHVEQLLASGAGDQKLPNIDGNRVVYVDDAAGFDQVFLFTFNAP